MNIKENKEFLIYTAFAVIISGLIGFYGGRYYEKTTFRSKINERPTIGTGEGRNFGLPGEMRVPSRDQSPTPSDNEPDLESEQPTVE